jgi:elongation factor P
MINVNDLRNGAVFKEDGALWQVVNFEHIKTGRGSGNIKVKVKNLKTGSLTEKSFITGARVEEAGVEKKKVQFLYFDGSNYNFMDPVSFEQFPLAASILGDQAKYLKDNMEVILIVSDTESLGLELPNSLIYQIKETGSGERGNTVSNVFKPAILDNELEVKVPMFMKVGDRVKIDTRSGEYIERVK